MMDKKNSIYMKNKYFKINVFTVTFDQVNASLQEKKV